MRVTTVLKRVLKLLSGRGRWARGDFAYDAEGNSVHPRAPSAASYCLLGACYPAAQGDQALNLAAERALDELAVERGFDSAACFNDHPMRTKRQVLAFVQAAIRRAEKPARK